MRTNILYFYKEMYMKKSIMILLTCILLSGCASIVKGRSKSINLMTSTGEQVEVDIVSASGTQQVTIPSSINVRKDNHIITVNVKESDCYRYSTIIVSEKVEPWVLVNLGLTYSASSGTTTDALSGAMWTYDDNFVVPVYKKSACQK
jgi:hypothetical protein